MVKPYSEDLRSRVVARVEAGRSCREVAAMFAVSVASVVKWSQRFRATGSVAASPMGSRMPRSLIGERDWLLGRIAAKPDIALRELVAELHARSVATMTTAEATSYGSVWRLLRDEGISFKKKPARQRTRPAGRSKAAGAMEKISRQT